jgi:hypothetical protein
LDFSILFQLETLDFAPQNRSQDQRDHSDPQEGARTRNEVITANFPAKICSEVKDLLTLLILSDDKQPESTIIDEGLTFLFAGYDTTSKLLVNCFFFHVLNFSAMGVFLFSGIPTCPGKSKSGGQSGDG